MKSELDSIAVLTALAPFSDGSSFTDCNASVGCGAAVNSTLALAGGTGLSLRYEGWDGVFECRSDLGPGHMITTFPLVQELYDKAHS